MSEAVSNQKLAIKELRHLRELRGVTQSRVAKLMGVEQSAISKLERRENPSVADVSAYVGVLGGELLLSARFADADFALDCFDEQPPSSR